MVGDYWAFPKNKIVDPPKIAGIFSFFCIVFHIRWCFSYGIRHPLEIHVFSSNFELNNNPCIKENTAHLNIIIFFWFGLFFALILWNKITYPQLNIVFKWFKKIEILFSAFLILTNVPDCWSFWYHRFQWFYCCSNAWK